MIQHTLYYVYDPMCSWCYAFAPTFEEVKNKLNDNINIVYIPGGLAKHSAEIMPKDMQTKIESIWYEIETAVGTKFNHDFWTKCEPRRSTYLSCQATIAARLQNKEYEMIKGIQEAYYQKAMNPSDKDTLITVAKSIGLDIKRFKKELTAESTITLFEKDLNLRRRLYVRAFPSLVLKYKKETYPIAHEYNNPQKILDQIEDLTTNVYF